MSVFDHFKEAFDDFGDPCLCQSVTHIVYDMNVPERPKNLTPKEEAEGVVKYRANGDIYAACRKKLEVPRTWDSGRPEGAPSCQDCLAAHEKNIARAKNDG